MTVIDHLPPQHQMHILHVSIDELRYEFEAFSKALNERLTQLEQVALKLIQDSDK